MSKPIFSAETLPSSFYKSTQIFEESKHKIFEKSWQWIGKQSDLINQSNNLYPFYLLEKYLDEPMLLSEQENNHLLCLSNVCTHRAFILSHNPEYSKKIVCKYHGRRFDIDGKMEHMPEFKEAEDFPRACDHLHQYPLKNWKGFLFTGITPDIDFNQITTRLDERLGFLDINAFRYAPAYDKTYNVFANWALYCDNYLEGFHIPFVHNSLGAMIDYGAYTTECYEFVSLQIAHASEGTPHFNFPNGHPDYGKKVAAYYYWIYPNTMLNVYPWGIQVNVILPQETGRTKVFFYHYLSDEKLWDQMKHDQIAEKTEREDEWVVEGVQRGMNSTAYTTGRYSPKREKGVYHFHNLIRQKIDL